MNRTARCSPGLTSALVAAGLAALSACKSPSSTGPVNVPLTFHPTAMSDAMPIATKARVYVTVSDDRAATMMATAAATMPSTMPAAAAVIGQNTQEANPVPVYSTGATPAAFVHDVVVDLLMKKGVVVVPSAAGADRTVAVSLKTFDATEGGSYNATVVATITVTDNTGKTLFSQSEEGDGHTWGQSRNAENYQQILTEASEKMVQSAAGNMSFVQALTSMQ